jgi:hypothetical protein
VWYVRVYIAAMNMDHKHYNLFPLTKPHFNYSELYMFQPPILIHGLNVIWLGMIFIALRFDELASTSRT